MSWGSPDVYYDPEKFGLTIVLECEKEPNYDFDKFVVWQDAEGNLFYGGDSGCSCPSPFEDFTSLDKLTMAVTIREIHDALDDHAYHPEYGRLPSGEWGPTGRMELDSEWREADVAEAHAKIAALPFQEGLFAA